MIKLLIISALIYFIYRYFIAPPTAIDKTGQEQEMSYRKEQTAKDDREYIDYEEVD